MNTVTNTATYDNQKGNSHLPNINGNEARLLHKCNNATIPKIMAAVKK